jgi:tight adherence protein B
MKWIALVMSMVCAGLLAWNIQQWLAKAVQQYRDFYTESFRTKLSELFLFVDPTQLWTWAVMFACVIAGIGFLITSSVFFCLIVALVWVHTPKLALDWLRRRRLRMFEQQLPSGLLSLASMIRVGLGVSMAFQRLAEQSQAPLSQELSLVLREQRLGTSFDAALENLRNRVPTESCALMVSTLQVATHSGGNLAETCERIAQMLRERIRIQGKLRALTAQGRMQAWIAGILPLLLLGTLTYLDPETMSLLWQTELGWFTLVAIGVLELAGIWLIYRVVAIDI